MARLQPLDRLGNVAPNLSSEGRVLPVGYLGLIPSKGRCTDAVDFDHLARDLVDCGGAVVIGEGRP